MVLQLSKKRSDAFLAFAQIGPTRISPNVATGEEECKIFFPEGYDIPEEEIVEEVKKKPAKKKGKKKPAKEQEEGAEEAQAEEGQPEAATEEGEKAAEGEAGGEEEGGGEDEGAEGGEGAGEAAEGEERAEAADTGAQVEGEEVFIVMNSIVFEYNIFGSRPNCSYIMQKLRCMSSKPRSPTYYTLYNCFVYSALSIQLYVIMHL